MKKDPESSGVMNSVKSEKDDDGEQDSEQDDPTGISLPGIGLACHASAKFFPLLLNNQVMEFLFRFGGSSIPKPSSI